MDLIKSGKLLCDLRKAKGMTQKQVADMLGVLPKTVSKWETGNGFPDISIVSALADILGVSERILLSGKLTPNIKENGNMKRIKFYVCPHCNSIMQGIGECQVVCCGKPVEPMVSKIADNNHSISVSEMDDDFYIEINHTMTKDHFISFVAYVGFDRVFMVRLYPEQDASVRITRVFKGKFYYYCNKDGLFEYKF